MNEEQYQLRFGDISGSPRWVKICPDCDQPMLGIDENTGEDICGECAIELQLSIAALTPIEPDTPKKRRTKRKQNPPPSQKPPQNERDRPKSKRK